MGENGKNKKGGLTAEGLLDQYPDLKGTYVSKSAND